MELKDIIFSTYYDEDLELVVVAFNDRKYWESNGYLMDYQTNEMKELIEKFLDENEYGELSPNIYETNYTDSPEELKEILLDLGFSFDPDFQEYMLS